MNASNFKAAIGHSGFTLLEVMVSVAIIAIALVAALGSQSQSVSLASEASCAFASLTRAFIALMAVNASLSVKVGTSIFPEQRSMFPLATHMKKVSGFPTSEEIDVECS